MKFLLLCSLLFSCTPLSPKYFAGQKVTFEWSEKGKFWSKVCKNTGIIKEYGSNETRVLYTAVVDCSELGGTGSMYQKFSIDEKQITGVVEQ